MTLITFLWTAALALFFAIASTAAYNRGESRGYAEGLEEGVQANITKIRKGEYQIDIGRIEEKEEDE